MVMITDDASELNPCRLLKDTLEKCFPIYWRLLLLSSPNLIWPLVFPWVKPSLTVFVLFVLYGLIVSSCVFGAVISFAYHSIDNSESSTNQLPQASRLPIRMQDAYGDGIENAPKLVLGSLRFGLMTTLLSFLLLIPGVLYALWNAFFCYFIVIEGESIGNSFRRSQILVAEQWWKVVLAILSRIAVFDFGVAYFIHVSMDGALPTDSSYAVLYSGAMYFLVSPFSVVYDALLFWRLRHSRPRPQR